MRIFLLSPDPDSPTGDLEMRACRVLRHHMILSARPGGIINDRPVVLVAQSDATQAVSVLKKSGIESVADAN
jgi:hypothetical protein